jgi:hypothetical protein
MEDVIVTKIWMMAVLGIMFSYGALYVYFSHKKKKNK